MPNPNGGLRIVPGNAPIAGLELQALAVVDPFHYPHGLDIIVSVPGSVVPLGHHLVPPGRVVAILPPEASRPVIEAFRSHMAKQRPAGPGEVKAPGL